MSDHGAHIAPLTDDARPHARRGAIADLDLDQEHGSTPLLTNVAGQPSSAPQDRRLSSSPDFESQPTVEQLQAVIADMRDAETAVLEDRDLADREVRRLRREADALRRELTELREDDPRAKVIREVCDYWIRKLGKTKRTKCPANGARWTKVRARMNDGYTAAQLKQAIDGCATMPFVGPRGRSATAETGAKRHDDLELICRDETTVERFIGYADTATKTCTCTETTGDLDCPAHTTPVARATRHADESEDRQFVRFAYDGRDLLPHEPAHKAPRPRPRDEFKVPPVDKVIPALHAAGCDLKANASDPDRWSGRCPAHDDRNPSLAVWRTADGRMRMKCWTGCQEDDILRASGLEHADCWRGSDYDTNAQTYQRGEKRSLPPHLLHAMEQLLARNERLAA